MRVIIRCRKCWVNVDVVEKGTKLKPCPQCGKDETYEHAFYLGKKPKKDQEAGTDGATGSS